MNLFAKIRKIEYQEEFVKLVNAIYSAETSKYQVISPHQDMGVDGYLSCEEEVFAIYCPTYPERTDLNSYKRKIREDVLKLSKNIKNDTLRMPIKKWSFVTPDKPSIRLDNYVRTLFKKEQIPFTYSRIISSVQLAVLFAKNNETLRHLFPELNGSIAEDMVVDIHVKRVTNKGYTNLEVYNAGSDSITDLIIKTDERARTDDFLYETDNPLNALTHSCNNLRIDERQYVHQLAKKRVNVSLSCLGTKSKKTFLLETFV